MTSNESQSKPGFRRSAADLLGVPESAPVQNVVDEQLHAYFDKRTARQAMEREEERRQYLPHTAKQLDTYARVSAQNEITIAGKPALRLVADHAIAEFHKPVESTFEVNEEPEQVADISMTLGEIRTLISKENEDIRDYIGQTGEDVPLTSDDPIAYAKRHNISVIY